jgi:hypothetical protein
VDGNALVYNAGGSEWVVVDPATIGGSGSFQLEWRFQTPTIAADPGSKNFRFDSATPASVTELYVSDTSNSGVDATTLLGALNIGDKIYIQQNDDALAAYLFSVSGDPTDNATWWTIPVAVDSVTGAIPGSNRRCTWVLVYGINASDEQVFTDMREPTGFVNRADSEISFDVGTRTFTLDVLAPATEYDYYIHGIKFTISSTKTVIIPDTTATYHFYMDNTETLQSTTTFDEDLLLSDNAYVANVVWNDTPSTGTDDLVVFGEERHGITMDAETHIHFHQSFGAQYINGLGLTNVVTEPGAPIDTDVQFTVASGEIRDEDLRHEIIDDGATPDNVFDLIQDLQPTAQIPVWFRTGATGVWNKAPATSFPFIYSDGVVFTGGVNGLLPWNEDTGATWQLTESVNNGFVLIHYFATNDVLNPVVAIQGITNYNNKPAGREQALNEINQLSGLPFLEFTPLATVIVEARSVYTNTPLARFRLTDDGFDYVDWRDTDLFGGGGGGGTTQNLWETITSDSGSTVANSPNDTITVAGTGGIATSISGDTLSIDGSGVGGGSVPIIQEDATPLANPPHSTINYGLGLLATDAGSNVADIDLDASIDDLNDVTITSVADNNQIRFDSGTGQWINVAAPPGPPSGSELWVQMLWNPIPGLSGTTSIDIDELLPDITEGTEVWTDTIDLQNSSSTLRVETSVTFTGSTASMELVFAVFRGSTCVGASVVSNPNKDTGAHAAMIVYDSPATTGNITYSVRVGKNGGPGTWYVNTLPGFTTPLGGVLEQNAYTLAEIGAVI